MLRLCLMTTFFVTQLMGGMSIAQVPPVVSQGSSGTGSATSTKQEVKKDEAAILPSAEGHKSSAAPTMVRDCTKVPADCTEPVTRADQSTAIGVQSK